MRKKKLKLLSLLAGGLLLSVSVGAAFAMADQPKKPPPVEVTTLKATGPAGFEIEIDPDLDAQFGPRPFNAVQAATIVEASSPGARVLKVELDEENGRAVWEVEAVQGARGVEALVDAFTGELVAGEADGEED